MWFVLDRQTPLTFMSTMVYLPVKVSKTIKSFVNDAFSPSFYIYFY